MPADPATHPPLSPPRGHAPPPFHRLAGALRRAAPALLLYVVVRLAGIVVVAIVAHHTGRSMWSALGNSWDSRWYAGIAQHGYGTTRPSRTPGIVRSDLAFFPLFPGLERAVTALVPVSLVVAGLTVAWVSAVFAAWGIHAVGERLYGRRAATMLVLLYAVLPHAVVMTMAYSEPLMTALAAWSLYALLTRRWLWAGSLALLAGLARPSGIAVAAAVLSAALIVLWQREGARRDWRIWTGALLAPLGWLGYVAWVGTRSGGPLGYFRIQREWGSRFDFGRSELDFIRRLVTDEGGTPHLAYYMGVAGVLVAVPALVLLILDRPPLPLLIYTLVLFVLAVGGSHYYSSRPRFLLPAFPLLFPAARAMAKARPRTVAVLTGSLTVLSLTYGEYLLLFSTTAP
ncbi:glycosyltransferase family 39 protein [Streptomyces sp. NBC_01387]|uniref:mannosyltransferase family protein n=1 Tax=Streptomyces sp. NBC_01387 TaxID=2903849 RepID=UPI0032434F3B